MITAVGLGYGKNDVSVRGRAAIKKADKLYAKTLLSPAGRGLKRYGAESFDALFESADDFDALAGQIADVLQGAGDAVYCTDGSGRDAVVKELIRRGADVAVIPGAIDAAGLTIAAADLASDCPYLDTACDLTVTELDDALLAGDVKLRLLAFYAPDTACRFTARGRTVTVPLEAVDRQKGYGVDAALFVPGNASLHKSVACFGDLLRIMARLTAPDGCPWDKAQTHESIRQNLIEEAYEAVDAIDAGDVDAMEEELGDVLLQAVFHCDIAARQGEFDLAGVLSRLCEKLYFRHTHIFGEVKAADAGEALTAWENAKAKEKRYESLYDVLSRMPKGFPSALRIGKAVKKVAKYDPAVTAASMRAEAERRLAAGDLTGTAFHSIAASALEGVEPETALNKAVEAYIGGKAPCRD